MVNADKRTVSKSWTGGQVKVLHRAALQPQVSRIFVHPAIKKALCEGAGKDRGWLGKVRPLWGHNYHFHIRIGCPKDSPECKAQPVPPSDEGCGADLAWWFEKKNLAPSPGGVRKPLLMSALPAACKQVLLAN